MGKDERTTKKPLVDRVKERLRDFVDGVASAVESALAPAPVPVPIRTRR